MNAALPALPEKPRSINVPIKTEEIKALSLSQLQQNEAVLKRLDFSDLKLKPQVEAFIRALPANNFVYNRAYLQVYGKQPKGSKLHRMVTRSVVVAALARLKQVSAQIGNEFTSWTFSQSRDKALAYVTMCEESVIYYRELISKLQEELKASKGSETLIRDIERWEYQRRKWSEAAQAWHETVNKMHGYNLERHEHSVEVRLVEVAAANDDDLAKLVNTPALDPTKELPAQSQNEIIGETVAKTLNVGENQTPQ